MLPTRQISQNKTGWPFEQKRENARSPTGRRHLTDTFSCTSTTSRLCFRHVSNTLHADDLAVWSASEYTTSSAYRIQEAVNKIEQWTNDWGLQISEVNAQATVFSLCTSKEKVAIKLGDKTLPQVETPTFLGVKLDTRLSWKPHIGHGEKRHQEACCPKEIVWNTPGCRLQDSKSRLHASSPAISGIWGQCMGDNSQDVHQQTGQSSEYPWCHENYSYSWNGVDRWSWTTWGQETGQTSDPCRKDEDDTRPLNAPKAQRPHKNRLKRKSRNHLVKEQQKEHADILTTYAHLCEKLNPNSWPPETLHGEIRTTIPGITSKENQSEAVLMALALEEIDKHYPVASWTHIYTDGSAENATRNRWCGAYIKRPGKPPFSVSSPGGILCSNYRAQVLALLNATETIISWEEKPIKAVFLIDSLSALQALMSGEPDTTQKKLTENISTLVRTTCVVLQWIPAHTGNGRKWNRSARKRSKGKGATHIVREPGGPTVHPPPLPPPPPPPPGTFHYGSKMYLTVSRTQSHLFPGQPLGCTGVIALCAKVPSCLQSVTDWAPITNSSFKSLVHYCFVK